jgi:hypothetical protein
MQTLPVTANRLRLAVQLLISIVSSRKLFINIDLPECYHQYEKLYPVVYTKASEVYFASNS